VTNEENIFFIQKQQRKSLAIFDFPDYSGASENEVVKKEQAYSEVVT